MNLTYQQIIDSLVAAGVAANKQDKIATDLLAIQGTPVPDPPLSQDEIRQIIFYVSDGSITRWPAWKTRETQARKQLTALFSALDARETARQQLQHEVSNLLTILGGS